MESTLDLGEAAARLERWLAARADGARVLRVSVPAHGGLSHETLLVEAEIEGSRDELVARVEPAGSAIFPDYDLAFEWNLMRCLHRATEIPVPTPRWREDDATVLGRRFFVMDRVAGEVPGDDPPFLAGGFLFDASPEDQAQAQRATLEVLAAIHRLDWRRLGVASFFERSRRAGLGVAGELARWRRYLDWASAGEPLPVLEAAYAWCVAHRPTPEPEPVLCWGDARYGNVVYDATLRPAAVLDWEMASIGPPELDLGWFCFIHDTARMWLADLPGFADRAGVVATYEAALGRPVEDLRWYEVWAGLRAAAIQAQIVRRARERDPGAAASDREDTPVVWSLRRLIDLPR